MLSRQFSPVSSVINPAEIDGEVFMKASK